jgi:hypothetical protein
MNIIFNTKAIEEENKYEEIKLAITYDKVEKESKKITYEVIKKNKRSF